jgi:hypothetical protein
MTKTTEEALVPSYSGMPDGPCMAKKQMHDCEDRHG